MVLNVIAGGTTGAGERHAVDTPARQSPVSASRRENELSVGRMLRFIVSRGRARKW